MQKNKGITLIALVITIIILLILAGVAISMITGGEGLLTKTKDTKNKYTHSAVYEALLLKAQDHQYDLYAKNTDKNLIEYLVEKEIVKQSTKNPEEYIVNVEKLSGKKIDLGNGTDEQTDVYKLVPRKSIAQVATLSIVQLAESNTSSTELIFDLIYFGESDDEPISLGPINDNKSNNNDSKEVETVTPVEYFTYRINDNNEVEITGINPDKLTYYDFVHEVGNQYTMNIERLEIPAEISGKPVTKVCFDRINDEYWPKDGICNVKEIIYPDTVKEITSELYFPDVENVKLPQNLLVLGEGALGGGTSIDPINYSGFVNLKTIEIPDSVITIGDNAFLGCSGLETIEIPDSVTSIGTGAFGGCASLSNVIIGGNVTNIGNAAFYDCNELTSITIPSSVISIGDTAFYGCRALTSVTIPTSVISIGSYAIGVSFFSSYGQRYYYDCEIIVQGKNGPEDFESLGTEWCGKNTPIYQEK